MMSKVRVKLITKYVQEKLILNNQLEVKPDEVMEHSFENSAYSIKRKSTSHSRRDLRKLFEMN